MNSHTKYASSIEVFFSLIILCMVLNYFVNVKNGLRVTISLLFGML
ncbi:hypothetical protein FORC47_p433 (plasmid) [Bacillus cereus]|nr:hypothetical protein FORC47_p433 [Bacillus cereus]